jgi:predicted DNA-binding transcriptional regulator YafY
VDRAPRRRRVEELCERFGIDRRTLLADLTTLSFVGVWPYSPDAQVEVVIEDDRVWCTPAVVRPAAALTPDQALALVAPGASLRRSPAPT